MKWTVLVGSLGLAIGFLAGRSEIVDSKEIKSAEAPTVKSQRSLRGTNRERKSRSQRTGGNRPGGDLFGEFVRGRRHSTISNNACLMKRILELDRDDFPDVFEELIEFGSFEDINEAIAQHRANYFDGLAGMALSRWYELEGEAALDWILAKVHPELQRNVSLALIRDGYHRNPDESFQLLKKFAALGDGGEMGLVNSDWFYEVGRFSRNLVQDLEELREISSEFKGDPVGLINDPFADPFAETPPELELVNGAIAAGREAELRAVCAETAPTVIEILDQVLQQSAIERAERQGWRALKGEIDSGRIASAPAAVESVFEEWREEDPVAAREWFLNQDIGNREEQIADSLPLQGRSDWQDRGEAGPFVPSEVVQQLRGFEAAGEPVGRGWGRLGRTLVRGDHWDQIEEIRSLIPSERWQGLRDRMVSDAIDTVRLSYGEGETLEFRQIPERDLQVLERFDLQDEALRQVAEENEAALGELNRRLGVE
jgi:hypothetical protein